MKTLIKNSIKEGIRYIKKPISLLPNYHKQKYNSVLNLLSISGLESNETPGLETDLKRVRTLLDFKERLTAARELVRRYPKHPLSHLELAKWLYKQNDLFFFDHLDHYGELRKEWLEATGLGELGLEFIWPSMVVGSLGNHLAIEGLLWANRTGLRTERKPVLLLSQNDRLRNPALFSYFEPYICVIRNKESIASLRRLEALLTLPLGFCLDLDEGCYPLDLAANRVESERKDQDMDPALFTLNDNHREKGMQVLRDLGLPRDAWYVALHVREPGYRGETRTNTMQNLRNADPKDYLKAIKSITNAGGWVFRIGDSSMTPLPPMPQVIDYAHHSVNSDWFDVFLGATCRFFIGTGSGPMHLPQFFGRPLIFTNYPRGVEYLVLRKQDLYLPRLLRRKSNKEFLTFKEYMSPQTSMIGTEEKYNDEDLEWVENTPDELEAVTIEMLERTAKDTVPKQFDDDLQKRFKAVAEVKYAGRPVKAFAPISRDFISQHADLLE